MSANAFRITLDYQFAPEIGNDPIKRSVMEAAAREWEKLLSPTQFPAIAPDTTFRFYNISTRQLTFWNTDEPIGDVNIAVVWAPASGVAAAANSSNHPWGGSWTTRFTQIPFQPWSGYLLLNSNVTSWWFDPSPETDDDVPAGVTDALDVAMHEMGHVLGISTNNNPFKSQRDASNNFAGASSILWNHGQAVPMSGSHIGAALTSGQHAGMNYVMQEGGPNGDRRYPGWAEAMILKDMGYLIDYRYLSYRSFKDAERAAQRIEP